MDSITCEPLNDADPQGLGLTYWFDAAPTGAPYVLGVRFRGTWLRRHETPDEHEATTTPGNTSFDLTRSFDVLPGTGRVALTTRIPHVAAGEWKVSATATVQAHPHPGETNSPQRPPILTAAGRTSYGPVINVRAPGARMGAWPALVTLGAVAALITQWFLAAQHGLPAARVLVTSLIACAVGLVGAKVYYLATRRAEKPALLTSGMCIQGFVIAAIGTVVVGSLATRVPIGAVLDVSVPGLLFGMCIGRLGCFLGGCCAGRPSASRWALWSSDRTVGVRRIPVQLIESAVVGILGLGAFVAVARGHPTPAGAVFVAGISANILARQLLFPLRVVPRATAHGRTAALILSSLALVGAVAALIV